MRVWFSRDRDLEVDWDPRRSAWYQSSPKLIIIDPSAPRARVVDAPPDPMVVSKSYIKQGKWSRMSYRLKIPAGLIVVDTGPSDRDKRYLVTDRTRTWDDLAKKIAHLALCSHLGSIFSDPDPADVQDLAQKIKPALIQAVRAGLPNDAEAFDKASAPAPSIDEIFSS